jgi:two-component system OmpR family response regulator
MSKVLILEKQNEISDFVLNKESNSIIDEIFKFEQLTFEFKNQIKDYQNVKFIIVSNEYLRNLSNSILDIKKEFNENVKILVLSNYQNSKFEVECFNNGVIDFINYDKNVSNENKSFIEIIFHRLFNIMKNENQNIIQNLFKINLKTNEFKYKDMDINLHILPKKVFLYLMQRKNSARIITKDEILNAIWPEPELVTPNVVDVCIMQINQKIDKKFNITTIETIPRKGFRFIM